MGLEEQRGGGRDAAAGRKPRGRKPGQRRRTPIELARDRKLVARLRLRNRLLTQEDIAAEVNAQYDTEEERQACEARGQRPPHVSAAQVAADIRRLEERLEAEAINDTLRLRRLQIAELEDFRAYCWDRHYATIGTHTVTTETKGGEGGTLTKTVSEDLAGETSYMSLALAAHKEIIDLSGTRPPKKLAPTNPEGTKPYDAFSDSEEIKRLRVLFEEITRGEGTTGAKSKRESGGDTGEHTG